jgi:hypothetical protein
MMMMMMIMIDRYDMLEKLYSMKNYILSPVLSLIMMMMMVCMYVCISVVGIGKGQTIKLLVVPEISDRINTQVSIGAGIIQSQSISLPPPTTSSSSTTAATLINNQELKQFLQDVLSWLMINSMRVDGVQFNLLCEQSVGNIWRKRTFRTLLTNYRFIDEVTHSPIEVTRALQVFRERIDFEIENSIPKSIRYSEKILQHINAHS